MNLSQDLVEREVTRRGLMPGSAKFASDEEFQKFMNNQDVKRWWPDGAGFSPQFTERPIPYFDYKNTEGLHGTYYDDPRRRMNPGLYEAFKGAGGTDSEIDHLHTYVKGEGGIRGSSSQYTSASKDIASLVEKTIKSEDPRIWFQPTETLYRGSRKPANLKSPDIGDIVEFDRFRSTTPDPQLAEYFANHYYRDNGKAENFFGKDSQPRIEVIEPLHGGLRLGGGVVHGEETEVVLKPAKFEVIDKKILPAGPYGRMKDPELERKFREGRGYDTDIEYLKYRQIYGMDPAAAALKGGADLLGRNLAGAATGAAMAATNPEVVQQVERGQYQRAAGSVLRDTTLGAISEAGIRSLVPVVNRHAPAVVRVTAPAMRFAAPAAIGTALFNQGRTGSLTDVVLNKAAAVVPGLKPNPNNDLGRRAGNELSYALRELGSGRMPYSRAQRGSSSAAPRPQTTLRSPAPAVRPRPTPARSQARPITPGGAVGNELTYMWNRLKSGKIPYTRSQ